ncbi:hypothetical protein L1987_75575 [Smallanthus sonchifolius]|uniref:Uncharacterized protein n=1 Tax=Smallanthus sonchifolius TaxID=185202 RepID=A0ACB9A6T0_9ASTR|nr:hypothetical protein L1987_75575 [Smallanthus sonchifolius]
MGLANAVPDYPVVHHGFTFQNSISNYELKFDKLGLWLILLVKHTNPNTTSLYSGMEDYRRQGGIQQLLVAEQEARQIVNAARTAKMNRLKQAKDEAEEEVAKYRAHMEKEYQKTISESTGFSGVNVKRLDEETVKKTDQLKKQAAKVSPEVIKLLMTQVTTVKV